MPTIRLGGEAEPFPGEDGPGTTARLRSREVEVGGVATRARLSSAARACPTVLLHGWLDNADTWLAVLDRLAVAGRPAIAYDLPGFGTAPPLDDGLGARPAGRLRRRRGRAEVAERVGEQGRRRRQLARRLGRAAARPGSRPAAGRDRPDRARPGCGWRRPSSPSTAIPAVSRIIGMPAPVPPAVVRSVAGQPLPPARVRRPRRRRPGRRRPLHPLPRRPAGDPASGSSTRSACAPSSTTRSTAPRSRSR